MALWRESIFISCCLVWLLFSPVSSAPTQESSYYRNRRQEEYVKARRALKEVKFASSLRQEDHSGILDQFRDIEESTYNYGVEDSELIEGDIKVPSAADGVSRKVISSDFATRWPDKTLPWKIGAGQYDPSELEYVRQMVKTAVAEWESRSCLKFPEDPYSVPVLEIINSTGCWSYIGQTSSVQSLSLKMTSRQSGCVFHGTIMHEFAHAAGIKHEQSRQDRDDEAKIFYGNIGTNKEHNFVKGSLGHMLNYANAPYDVTSVMHYSLTGFTKNGAKTISMVKPELDVLVGQRVRASFYDEVAINRAYDCAEGCPEVCENHGYARRMNGECRCICAPYLGGTTCAAVSTTCGGSYILSSGETISFHSEGSDYMKTCAYLFTASVGHYLRLRFTEFNLPADCSQSFDVRNNAVGQESYQLLCGSAAPNEQATQKAIQKDKMLVVYNGEDSSYHSYYQFEVTAVPDSCLYDPCHGAKCIDEGQGQYRCLFPEYPIHCGFEQGLVGGCSAMKVNSYYDNPEGFNRAWDLSTSNPTEGAYYWNAYTVPNYGGAQIGTMSIMPTLVGGGVWCLDFKYFVTGSSSRSKLNIYQVVNGEKGNPIFSAYGRTTPVWDRQMLEIDGSTYLQSDMIEVMFEAYHESTYDGNIGIDDIKYRPGSCLPSTSPCKDYPCGTHQCIEVGGGYKCIRPSGDLLCTFEADDSACNVLVDLYMTNDDIDPVINTGFTPSDGTGPSSALSGTTYVYLEASSKVAGSRAYIRILPLEMKNQMFSFWYHAHGRNMGRLLLHKIVNHETPSASTVIDTIVDGEDQGDEWKLYQTALSLVGYPEDTVVELILEMVVGSSWSGDIAIDDIQIRKIENFL